MSNMKSHGDMETYGSIRSQDSLGGRAGDGGGGARDGGEVGCIKSMSDVTKEREASPTSVFERIHADLARTRDVLLGELEHG